MKKRNKISIGLLIGLFVILSFLALLIIIGTLGYLEESQCYHVFTLDEVGKVDLSRSDHLWLDDDFSANNCETDGWDCSDFCTKEDAKKVFDECFNVKIDESSIIGDIHNLDLDGDGIPCESLPSKTIEKPDNVQLNGPAQEATSNIKTFHGYKCTQDCSGHIAGYEWAEKKDINDINSCTGNSQSFIEGCKAYVEENY